MRMYRVACVHFLKYHQSPGMCVVQFEKYGLQFTTSPPLQFHKRRLNHVLGQGKSGLEMQNKLFRCLEFSSIQLR